MQVYVVTSFDRQICGFKKIVVASGRSSLKHLHVQRANCPAPTKTTTAKMMDEFNNKSRDFVQWFNAQRGTKLHPSLRLEDFRRRGAGRGLGLDVNKKQFSKNLTMKQSLQQISQLAQNFSSCHGRLSSAPTAPAWSSCYPKFSTRSRKEMMKSAKLRGTG